MSATLWPTAGNVGDKPQITRSRKGASCNHPSGLLVIEVIVSIGIPNRPSRIIFVYPAIFTTHFGTKNARTPLDVSPYRLAPNELMYGKRGWNSINRRLLSTVIIQEATDGKRVLHDFHCWLASMGVARSILRLDLEIGLNRSLSSEMRRRAQ